VVYNFISLAIIAEFDDFVFSALRNEPMKLLIKEDVIDKLLVIRHTSSPKCGLDEMSTVVDEDSQELRPLRVEFSKRSGCNKLMFV